LNEVVEKIRAELGSLGVISFARFMELALYCPLYGYYEKEEDTIGAAGDYFTSAAIGPLFGELLAFRFSQWLESPSGVASLGPEEQPGLVRGQIVEAGAHKGHLAKDILSWMRQYRPALFQGLEYWIIEPSPIRRGWQEQTLSAFSGKLRWFESLPPVGCSSSASPLPPAVQGIIFANELLDAMPVHRLGWDAREQRWFEWGVRLENDALGWERMLLDPAVFAGLAIKDPLHPFNLPTDLLAVLPEGFTTEVSPAALAWWRSAADALRCGFLLTIDYGLDAADFFVPERNRGTLRAYHRHQAGSDLLAQPGEQDLTAHVNFSLLQHAGESCGLKTEALVSQAKFLTEIFTDLSQPKSGFGNWTSAQTRQFQTLTHPDHLGRSFRVLIQKRCNSFFPRL
jgi:SAM-dependent MidA family methyltransferase